MTSGDSTSKDPASRRRVPRGILIAGVVAIAAIILVFVFVNRGHEATDDAFVDGHIMQISPQVAGQVAEIFVTDNQLVHKGDTLVRLDSRENQAIYDQAVANLASAQAKYAQAQAQASSAEANLSEARAGVEEARATAENAAKELARNQELRKRGVVSQQDLDRSEAIALSSKAVLDSRTKRVLGAESEVTVSTAQVKSAEAQVKLAAAMQESARLRLSFTNITAPEDGRVTRKNVELGNYVQTGSALMALVPENVWIIANFKETQLRHMRPGQSATIKVDAYPFLNLNGKVDSIQAGTGARFSLLPAENATGNYVKVVQRVPVKIVLTDPPKDAPLLAPGMSVIPTVNVK